MTQVINESGHEFDTNYGRSIEQADVLANDCCCNVAGQWIKGLDEWATDHRETIRADQDRARDCAGLLKEPGLIAEGLRVNGPSAIAQPTRARSDFFANALHAQCPIRRHGLVGIPT